MVREQQPPLWGWKGSWVSEKNRLRGERSGRRGSRKGEAGGGGWTAEWGPAVTSLPTWMRGVKSRETEVTGVRPSRGTAGEEGRRRALGKSPGPRSSQGHRHSGREQREAISASHDGISRTDGVGGSVFHMERGDGMVSASASALAVPSLSASSPVCSPQVHSSCHRVTCGNGMPTSERPRPVPVPFTLSCSGRPFAEFCALCPPSRAPSPRPSPGARREQGTPSLPVLPTSWLYFLACYSFWLDF